jgi:Tol biopolymer transport system component
MIKRPHHRAIVGVLAGAAVGLVPALLAGAGMLAGIVGEDSPPVSPPVAYDSPSFCGPGTTPRPNPLSDSQQFTAGNGIIAYEANCRGTAQIFIAFPSGQGARPITTLGGHEPAWSPDGQRIAFVRGDHPGGEIYTMGVGGNEVRLTTVAGAGDRSPSWSPDGRSIVFSSLRGQGISRLYIMDADGRNVRALTTSEGLEPSSGDTYPAWSPAGDRIVFQRENGSGGEYPLWTIRPDGTGLTRIVDLGFASAIQPAWSPDGGQIVLAGGSPCQSGPQLFVVNADGSNRRNLSGFLPAGTCLARGPVWSPDGARLLFSLMYRCPCPDGVTNPLTGLYTMRPDGSDFRAVLYDPTAKDPSWQRLATAATSSSSSTSSSSTTSTIAPTTSSSSSTSSSSTTSTSTSTTSTTVAPTTTTAPVTSTCGAIQALLARTTDPAQRASIKAAAAALGCAV